MGQTLTHGIYLPDEGERNCYNGLAANWSILDGAVGTVAEHSTQISGKAPLVHTHTKSDITDLFNSANTWTEDNTYSKAITVAKNSDTNFFLNTKHTAAELGSLPSSDQSITWAFKDKNDDNLCYARVYYETTGGNSFRIFVRNKYTSGAPSPSGTVDYAYFGLKINADKSKEGVLRGTFRPYDNNTYDLGSSANQWNNLYAKNYYYNGVAWGLDKSNTWTGTNTFTAATYGNKIVLKNTGLDLSNGNSGLTDTYLHFIQWVDNSNTVYAMLQGLTKSANTTTVISNKYKTDANTSVTAELRLENSGTAKSFYSNSDGDTDLGTSSKRWKTLNGINPGALSLPDLNTAQTIDRTGWAYDGSTYNSIKLSSTDTNMTKNGWLYVRISSTGSSDKLSIKYNSTADRYPTSSFGDTGGCIEVFVPVIANSNVYLCATKDLQFCKFYPCLGNVPSGV